MAPYVDLLHMHIPPWYEYSAEVDCLQSVKRRELRVGVIEPPLLRPAVQPPKPRQRSVLDQRPEELLDRLCATARRWCQRLSREGNEIPTPVEPQAAEPLAPGDPDGHISRLKGQKEQANDHHQISRIRGSGKAREEHG